MSEFRRTEHECCVCFVDYIGTQIYLLHRCQHCICRECMETFCQINVREGTLKELKYVVIVIEKCCVSGNPVDPVKNLLTLTNFKTYFWGVGLYFHRQDMKN